MARVRQQDKVTHRILADWCWLPKNQSGWSRQWDAHILPRHGHEEQALNWQDELGRPKSFFVLPEGATATSSAILRLIRAMTIDHHGGGGPASHIEQTKLSFSEQEGGAWRIVLSGRFKDAVGRTDVRRTDDGIVSCPAQHVTVVFALNEDGLGIITAFPS